MSRDEFVWRECFASALRGDCNARQAFDYAEATVRDLFPELYVPAWSRRPSVPPAGETR